MKISLLPCELRVKTTRVRMAAGGEGQTWVQFCHALGDWLGEQLVMALTTLLLAFVVVAAPILLGA